MSEPTEIPKGSYAAGERVKLPAGAEPPFTVFINGVEQSDGADYSIAAGEIVFSRPIVKEKMGTGRWLAMYLGLFGHLPQGRESRPPVQPQRQGRADPRPPRRPLPGGAVNIGFVLLADYSEAVNGKLYLTGGGWNVLRLPELPHEWSFHIGLGIDVAWHETNNPHELIVTIQDPDGIELGDGLTANFETGRPPGMPQGQEQRLVMSIAATATFATAGPHAAVVQVNGEELGRGRFYLMEGEAVEDEIA